MTHPANLKIMEAEGAKDEAVGIIVRMISAEVIQTRQGYSMRSPNDGYQNVKEIVEGKKRSVHAVDEQRAKYYRELFRLRAAGNHSDQEIADRINAMGYLSKRQNIWQTEGKQKKVVGKTEPKPMTVKQLQKVVRRTMYAGVKFETWNKLQGPVWAVFATGSEPIVNVETFNRANRGKIFIGEEADGKPQVLYDFVAPSPFVRTRKKFHPDYTIRQNGGLRRMSQTAKK